MKEIGSEFWDVPVSGRKNTLFPASAQWFLSGRSAVQSVIRSLGSRRSVAMPSWCCESMIRPFSNSGIDVHFYPVYWKNALIQEIDLNCDILFLMDYFGYTGKQPDLSGYKGVVIRDVTHSVFSADYSDADFYFGSLRKWCGVWTGGYVWANGKTRLLQGSHTNSNYILLRKQAMEMKKNYINSRGGADKSYLSLFGQAEEILDGAGADPAADRDVALIKKLDVDGIIEKRRNNANVLRAAFRDWLVFPEMRDTDCPMFVPVFVPDGKRDELRRFLIQKEIYCPVHWPVSKYHKLDEQTEYLYQNELSLVCDQRYGKEDMNRIVDAIHEFFTER